MKHIAIAALGGTITMVAQQSGQGAVPTLDANMLVESVPALRDIAQISAQTLLQKSSGSLTFADIFMVLDWAEQQVKADVNGIVITQGTDTLEETAFLFDLYWNHDVPVVFTGAMRTPTSMGADGSANILAACLVARSHQACGRGVLVVMNDTIHSAFDVVKAHTMALEAFQSPLLGPVGRVVEGEVVILHQSIGSRNTRSTLKRPAHYDGKIAYFESALNEDCALLRHILECGAYQGLVIAGYGAGHVSHESADIIAAHAQHVPIIIASRTGRGFTAQKTYGYQGGEIDLMAKGAMMAGRLQPRKARLLLWALCAQGSHLHDIRAQWPLYAHSSL